MDRKIDNCEGLQRGIRSRAERKEESYMRKSGQRDRSPRAGLGEERQRSLAKPPEVPLLRVIRDRVKLSRLVVANSQTMQHRKQTHTHTHTRVDISSYLQIHTLLFLSFSPTTAINLVVISFFFIPMTTEATHRSR